MCTRAVGGLAHFIEDEGISTTQISLVRLHTEKISPPRALWVPFEMGRPLGTPNNPEFQKRVLTAALRLLEAEKGPVLADFPEDAPISDMRIEALSCPVSFPRQQEELSETQELCDAFKAEVTSLRAWYDMAVQERQRTTVGVSGVEFDIIPDFICSFLEEESPKSPNQNLDLPHMLNLAVDDLKAYYTEAITAQPGQELPSSKVLSDWFWIKTLAGEILFKIRDICSESKDPFLRIVGSALLIPSSQLGKK